ncbi:hypothetical protein C7212DRAFT_346156 [Tuber magnatum]|uniref:Uncharacterized protein n=1 Tax=Tuber magnatum TaxID=42249 RepID=A0A317SL72_9PEZI|nr:hypothetical protein C7212DRAFT_346156 [Tuber magnatum]
MHTDTPNATTAGDNSGTPAGGSEGPIICPDPFIEAENETIGALEYGLYGMITGRADMVREAMARLGVAIEQEKKEKKEARRKEEERGEGESLTFSATLGVAADKSALLGMVPGVETLTWPNGYPARQEGIPLTNWATLWPGYSSDQVELLPIPATEYF